MVKLCLSTVLLLFTINGYAVSQLTLDVPAGRYELGDPIRAIISAQGINADLSNIDLQPLSEHFGVTVIESSTISVDNGESIQRLELSLYPHRTGNAQIPPVELSGFRTKQHRLFINNASLNDAEIIFAYENVKETLWQRQQLIITAAVVTSSKFARLEANEFAHKDFDAHKITPSREKISDDLYKLTAGWVLYPQIAGNYRINMPAINYRLSGIVQKRFFPDNLVINVKKLPPYIPPRMPVGEIMISSKIVPLKWPTEINRDLEVTLRSHTLHPNAIPSLSSQFVNHDNMHFGKLKLDSVIHVSPSGSLARVRQTLPVFFQRSGRYSLPEVVIRYFDPEQGVIVVRNHNPGSLIVIQPITGTVMLTLLALLLYLAIPKIIQYISKSLTFRKNKIDLLTTILSATSPFQLHSLLNDYAKLHDWGSNMSLRDWQRSFQENTGRAGIGPAITELSDACYGKAEINETRLDKLNKDFYRLLTGYK